MSNDVLTAINTRNPGRVSQRTKAVDGQVANNAGGFVFQVTPEERIRRFLVLGTDKPTYYQNTAELTKQNADVLLDWAKNHTRELVDLVLEISEGGRSPKQNAGLFALAAAAGLGDDAGRKYALEVMPRVARTGSTLLTFVKYLGQFRGWSRGLRTGVSAWYEGKDANALAYQMTKYRNRDGYTHRDVLRLTHPKGASPEHKALYNWTTKGAFDETLPSTVIGFEKAMKATTVAEWTSLVSEYGLSWEMLPDAALTESKVWEALIDKGLPLGALIRQLPRLTRLNVLKGARLTKVLNQLNSQEALAKARIHPIKVLEAAKTYSAGRNDHGTTWTPNVKIIDALNDAFYKCFGNVEPANKRTMNAIDISGSMDGGYWGWGGALRQTTSLTPREVAAAMSLVTVATEPEVQSVGFCSTLQPLNISARQRLDDVIEYMRRQRMGRTDCAQPMLYAREKSLEIDTFVIWTDNETWSGNVHPFQALKDYRKASGINAKLVVCAVTPTEFSIADPSDAGMLDVVGFDSNVPSLIANFSAGRI